MNLISLEVGPQGYLLLMLLAGTLFFWLRRWLRGRGRSGAAAVAGAAILAFVLAAAIWLLLVPVLATRLGSR